MQNFGNKDNQKREYIFMGALLAALLLIVPTALCWHGSFALLEWRPLALILLVMASASFSLGASFFCAPRKYFVFLLLFAGYLSMPIWAALVSGIEVTWLNNAGFFCRSLIFAITMAGLPIFVSAIFRNAWLKRLSFLVMSFVPVMFAAVFVGYIFSSHAWLNTDAFMMILQTNPSEAFEYCKEFLSPLNIMALVLFFAVWIVFTVWSGKIERNIISGVHAILYGLLLLTIVYTGSRCMEWPALPYATLIDETRQGYALYEEFEKKREERLAHMKTLTPAHEVNKGVYILVIGESQNKNHMSVYGYDRETTPWLNSMKNSKESILFTRARACHPGTMGALSYALTAKNQYNEVKLEDAVTLAEAAKDAGFKTVWLSNQIKYSVHDTPTTVIASETDKQIWMNHHMGVTSKVDVYDGALVNELVKLERSDKMLFIVHLMGNHVRYCERYPGEFAKFTGKGEIVDFYDDSMLYNDYVMQRLYETVKEWPDFAGIMYMSDHGEDPDNDYMHDGSHFTWAMVEIPLYMIFSESYQREHTQFVEALRNAKDKPVTNDLMFNMALSVMGIDYSELYEPENDISSERYDANPERFKTFKGKKKMEW